MTPSSALRNALSTVSPRTGDPRPWQILTLASLLAYGVAGLGFEVSPGRIALVLGAALATQALASRLVGLPRFDPRSAFITGLSTCLLLRTGTEAVAVAAVTLAIASKFFLRYRGKHVWNPANLGLVAAVACFDDARISPGQWGSAAWLALFLACAGMVVTRRAERSDVAWALLGAWAAVCGGRAAWLGDPWAIPAHQLGSGAFLIFAFFMISDPKTTPDRRTCRIAWAGIVAALAGWIEFGLHRPAGLILALAACAPLVPVLDTFWPAAPYAWPGANSAPSMSTREPSPTSETPSRHP